ncbi:MAG: TonB-dependent receptor [Pseudomonadales bacterium]|nr:TonB-dependent receptor [Pseudomonadales bacterium]MBP9035176.1 TonB-dependent receptor [Pseudomonadales bacterium]
MPPTDKRTRGAAWLGFALVCGGCAIPAWSAGIEEVVVTGRQLNLVGEAISASQGVIGQAELELRPLLRTGEILEAVPGLVATQHSGTGKANQYFLRGFNLDHGTDFATFYDHMPVNMRTHGHGQGYTDLNFVIPELVQTIAYQKGAYYADVGDFSSAGSASITPMRRLERGEVGLSAGENGFRRVLAMDSSEVASGNWLYALEASAYDGPWTDIDEDLEKLNGTLRRTWTVGQSEASLAAMAYDSSWNSADQIPRRAVTQGLIDEKGSLDTTVGGESSRYSLNAAWDTPGWRASAYAVRYDLDLWSNFTYLLDDPIDGDQFQQVDQRWIYGGDAVLQLDSALAGHEMQNRIGVELRYDDIDEVGLYRTQARRRIGAVRDDAVEQLSTGVYWQNEIVWSEAWRSTLGLRYDYFDFDVASQLESNVNGVDLQGNSGTENDALFSVKGSLVYKINDNWEAYASAGQGFHSNDARGTTARIDPVDGAQIEPVDPLVRSTGAEAGLRVFARDRLNASVALWWLQLDSELLFVGDAGTTEPSRESERQGLELTAYYRLADAWTLDVEYALADAGFTEPDPGDPALGDHVPGAIESVASVGLSAKLAAGWFGSVRMRYFGPRALEESGRVESHSTTVFNLRAGYEWTRLRLALDVLNLLDSDDHDIDYFYESQLAGETQGVEDLHYHVMEPRTVRAAATWHW